MSSSFVLPAAVERDIQYTRAGNVPLYLDASVPEGPGPHPAVIVVHGGAWISGDRARSVAPLLDVLTDAGFAWFSVSYRFASDFLLLGTAIDDVQEAVRFVRSNAGRFRIDAGRIALAGESAGAHLASMAATRGTEDRSSTVAAVVALYSPSDLVSLAQTSPLVPARIRDGVKGTVFADMVVSFLRTLSPSANLRPDLPPFLLIHGTADSVVPYWQSVEFCNKLNGVGGNCELVTVKGGEHGLRSWRTPVANEYKERMVEWLRRQVGSRPPQPAGG